MRQIHVLGNVNLMKNGGLFGYAIRKTQRRIFFFGMGIWNGIQDFLYTHDTDKLYQLSLSSDGSYTMSSDIAASIHEQIDKLDEKTYAVKRKWDVLECDNEVYICKIAQKWNCIRMHCKCKKYLRTILKAFVGKAWIYKPCRSG